MKDFRPTDSESIVGVTECSRDIESVCTNPAAPTAHPPKYALGVSQEQCAQELRQQFDWKEGELREVRVLDWPGDRCPRIADVTSPEAAALIIASVPYGASVFITMNLLDPVLYGAGSKILTKCEKGKGAADAHVLKRTCFAVDIDPVRPAGTCATKEQVEAAEALAKEVGLYLSSHGWPTPTVVRSGNGKHMYWGCDLQTNSTIPSRVLKVLNERFSTEFVKVDKSIGNAARIMRCAGTWNTKGGAATSANHRLASLVLPGSGKCVSEENFAAIVGHIDEPIMETCTVTPTVVSKSETGFDVEEWMAKYDVKHGGCEDWAGGGQGAKRWVLTACAFDPSHDRGEAVVTRSGDGTLGHKCHHDSCSECGWKKFRALVESKAKSEQAVVSAHAGGAQRYGQRTPYPLASLPAIIRDAVVLQSKIAGVDPAAIAVPMVAAFIGVVGAAARVCVYGPWEEAMATYCALVAPSGGLKTATLGLSINGLYELESSFPEPLEGESRMRLVTTDPTVEAVAKLISGNPRGVIVYRDELAGFFQSMGQYKAHSSADETFWLTGVDGGFCSVDRKAAESYKIRSLNVTVIGGIQPTILRSIMTRSRVESGMASRFWYVFPPRKKQEFKIPLLEDTQELESLQFRLGLTMRSLRTIPYDGAKPLRIECTPEAQQLINDYATTQEELIHLLADVSMERSFRAKSRGWCVRLAGLIALLRNTQPVMDPKNVIDYSNVHVTAEDMVSGIKLATWQVEENTRLCRALELDDLEGELARKNELALDAISPDKSGLTVRELSRNSSVDADTAKQLLDALVGAGLWVAAFEPIADGGGRPSKRYYPKAG